MKKILFALLMTSFLVTNFSYAQTADEVIESYLETIGGRDAIAAIKTMKSVGKVNFQGMEIPFTMYQKAPGAQKLVINFQGQEITQMSFDGNEGWGTNFMTMEPEKWESEDSELMKSEMDFPEVFLTYKDKGYSAELEGEENIEGTDCYRLKLTKKPMTIDGKEEENFVYYFIDKETNVPVMVRNVIHKGDMKGKSQDTFMSDYQEVNGVYQPFTLQIKLDGQTIQSLSLDTVEVNVDMDDALFAFPGK
ncbi:MAG: outer membrane lipoprotein-sorting protein [Saprospiraceae bacterium]|nr:outer membrane lipoprotein-sorting protein [Saprospiraceae bacterium]